jgi:probable phosphoglycerate mutase
VAEGLAAAARLGLDRVEVRTDSRLVVRHLVTERPVRNPALKALRDRARATADDLAGVTYRWVPADENARADALVAALLD